MQCASLWKGECFEGQPKLVSTAVAFLSSRDTDETRPAFGEFVIGESKRGVVHVLSHVQSTWRHWRKPRHSEQVFCVMKFGGFGGTGEAKASEPE